MAIPFTFTATATGNTLFLTVASSASYVTDASSMGGIGAFGIVAGYTAGLATYVSSTFTTGYTGLANPKPGSVNLGAFTSDGSAGPPPGTVLVVMKFTLVTAAQPDFPLVLTKAYLNNDAPASGTADPAIACFVRGTRIDTQNGPVAVEALQVGDMVLTQDGEHRAVKWIGRRRLACGAHPAPHDVMPIRIHAGAIGDGIPARDLLLSPDHSLCIDGALIPVRYLLNGATIVQETWNEVTYFHVELDRHAVLFAEGVPAESYLDTGNRGSYDGVTTVVTLPSHALSLWAEKSCLPLVFDGPGLERARTAVLARASLLGHATTLEADLHLVVDGQVVRGKQSGAAVCFSVPAGAQSVRLRSRCFVPAYLVPGSVDYRPLGVAATVIELDGQAAVPDATDGWYAADAGVQWTNGDAALPAATRDVRIVVAAVGLYWAIDGVSELPATKAA